MAHRVIPPLALFVLACGGPFSTTGDAGPSTTPKALDCTWAASELNCWKQAIKAAELCLPPQGEVGTFSADMKTCTFGGGKVVSFDPAATIPPPDQGLSFTIQDCISRTGLAKGHFKIQTSAGTVEQLSPSQSLLVTCPDGSKYEIANVLDLTTCGGSTSLDYVPGDISTWASGGISYGLTNWPGNQTKTLFTCRQ